MVITNRGIRDSRTLLPVRDDFYKDIQPLLDRADSEGISFVLLVIDIDRIDFVLRTFGPRERDEAVQIVGTRIRETIAHDDMPYHITEGRFAVVSIQSTYKQAKELSGALVNAIKEPIYITDIPLRLDASVGISHYPNHADSLGELVRTSVFACIQARENKNDYATFDGDLDEEERCRFSLMVDLERALDTQTGIQLAYQPLVNLENGQCVGVEGLCRWHHKEKGLIPPADFLPFVEHTPLIMLLTETILGVGLNDLTQMRKQGFTGKLAINLSPSLFRHHDLLERLYEQFRFYNVSPENVDFEITESGMMDQPNRAVNMLSAIRERGNHISVDDFGTGHSSLAYLADLPINTIKIDKHFIQNLSLPWGEAIVGAAATLADKLGLTTVAEGIEEEWQYQKCCELGINIGQGFYIGRPMFKEDFQQWMISATKVDLAV